LTDGKFIRDCQVEDLIKPMILIMTETELKIYRELGKDTAEIMEEVCYEVQPGMTELKVASTGTRFPL